MFAYLNIKQSTAFLCLLAVLAISFTGITNHDLWSPDEHRVAAISLQMAKTGDLVVPRLSDMPFVEKPPLSFILYAGMIKVVGPIIGKTAAIRMGTALLGLGVLLLTFLLGRYLGGPETGFFSVLILATMEGFVENFHWIRVDAALSFFVSAAAYCLLRAYRENRFGLAVLGGLAMAGSFLTKGLIGPLFVGIPWFILCVEGLFYYRHDKKKIVRLCLMTVSTLLTFMAASLIWIIPFYIQGGKVLWHEWFWVNHVGRFTGESSAKGHMYTGRPFYYIKYVLVYGLPWSPLMFYWFIDSARRLFKKSVTRNDVFLMLWVVLSVVMLTVSATKRPIYLTPILFLLAVVAASGLNRFDSTWFKPYVAFWMVLATALMLLISVLPFTANLLPDCLPPTIVAGFSRITEYHVIPMAGVLLTPFFYFRFRQKIPEAYVLFFITGTLYISLLGAPMVALDFEKGYKENILKFTDSIPQQNRNRIAGLDLTETTLGCLYYYSGLMLESVTDSRRIQGILKGNDPDYDSLIVKKTIKKGNENSPLAPLPYHVQVKTPFSSDHVLYLINEKSDSSVPNLFSHRE